MRAFRVTLPEEEEDLGTALLFGLGTVGIEVGVAAPGQTTLLAYFSGEISAERLREALPAASVESVPVPEVDWVARFRESFRSFRVGRFLIAPAWEQVEGSAEIIVVDPGRAFGTGTHETTRLCLGALEDVAGRRSLGRVLDVGTGTGILAVAAARLGARLVVASDNDEEALASARHHAGLNRVTLHLLRADGATTLRPATFDLVMANLTAPLLVDHAPDLSARRRPGGVLVLSGLLEEDLPDVLSVYATCGEPEVRREGEWAALVYAGAS